MTDRYSVDALAPQYDEIARICMMGKPVILTRGKQELVLMNPVEFRKMMQLVSRIQETSKEKEAALEHASLLEKELDVLREELARTKRELEEARTEAKTAREEAVAALRENPEPVEVSDTRDNARDDVLDSSRDYSPDAFQDNALDTPDAQEYPDSRPEEDVPAQAELQFAPAEDDFRPETDLPLERSVPSDDNIPAGEDIFTVPAAVDVPEISSEDHLAHFLNAVASSINKRTQMEMEPVPEGLAIEVEGLTKKFGGGVTANSGISLHIPYGAVYGLLGMNGSGRSTLVRSLLGLTFPNSGKITLCNASGKELNDIRELTGSILDVPVLYEHMSINQNMIFRAKLLRLKAPKPAIKDALKKFGLFDKKRKKVRTLSSGAKQKLALALAVLGNPELLILDEPLKGLDAADIAIFCNVMMEMNARGSTILITDCRTDGIAGIATHYGIIENGELIREISAKQILENPVDLDREYLAAGEV